MGTFGEDRVALARLRNVIRDQDGVVARRQVLACGLDSAFVRRRLRKRDWVQVYPGIYITHTGPLTWLQRAWCAILLTESAALCDESALLVASGGADRLGGSDPIHLAIASGRRLSPKPGVVFRRRADLAAVTMPNALPPRVRVEDAVLSVAAKALNEIGVIAALADPVQARLTTADRLLTALEQRPRLRYRAFIRDVLHDVERGTCSALEHRYLTMWNGRTAFPHRTGRRRRPSAGGASAICTTPTSG